MLKYDYLSLIDYRNLYVEMEVRLQSTGYAEDLREAGGPDKRQVITNYIQALERWEEHRLGYV